MSRVDKKNEAIRMKKMGFTYSEIQEKISDLPKSTLFGWLKVVHLSDEQKTRIENKMFEAGESGRQKGA